MVQEKILFQIFFEYLYSSYHKLSNIIVNEVWNLALYLAAQFSKCVSKGFCK